MTSNNDSIREEISNRIQKMLNELVPFPRKPFYFGDCVDDILAIISDAKKEAEKAYGGCHNCYGKGYATTIDYTSGSPDFIGDRGFKRQNDIMRFCDCERGKQLKTLVTTLKEQSSKGEQNE